MKYSATKIYELCLNIFNEHKYEYKGVDVVYISQIFISEYLLELYNENTITKILKKNSLDDIARYLFYKKNHIFNFNKNYVTNSILFFFEIKNQSMIENLYSMYENMKKNNIDVKLIANNQKLLDVEIDNVFKNANLIKSFFNIIKLKNTLKSLAKQISDNLKKEIDIDNNFEKHLYFHFLNNIFVIDTLDKYLGVEESKKIVLVTDVHKWSRTMVLLSKKYNKKTYVLQHGATVLEYGYLPITTDNFIAWGELSKTWLTRKGADENQIQILGSPKFDFLFNRLIHNTVENNKHILVILNPIGREKIKEFFSIIMPSLEKINIKTIIKLHPSSDDYRDIAESKAINSLFKIKKQADITKLIQESKVVITTTSSVGIEAILLKKPLCQIKIDGMPQMDYEDYGCQHDIYLPQDLSEIILNDFKLKSKIKNYEKFIQDYCNQFNGTSIKKIKDYILND